MPAANRSAARDRRILSRLLSHAASKDLSSKYNEDKMNCTSRNIPKSKAETDLQSPTQVATLKQKCKTKIFLDMLVFNDYYSLLKHTIKEGVIRHQKKGDIQLLPPATLTMTAAEVTALFATYPVPQRKLEEEVRLFAYGCDDINILPEWWRGYGVTRLHNSYPKYFPTLVRAYLAAVKNPSSKNNVACLGGDMGPTTQQPCITAVAVQEDKVVVFARSTDLNLGLPCNIYQLAIAVPKMLGMTPMGAEFIMAAPHIYVNNLQPTADLLATGIKPKFNLNV